ncbi:methionine ABC transporter ATP-binding protein [Anaerosinus massiliensis]|uniref:methionine ABC transporter ATP-binding protein n=1 Tax=Massilibacillus massiliensis TaxID=1806837 RepID=UPI000A8460EE|nr:methionine ABC transporter ATP-binding protein [Massilibacillus massiliensis]
MIKLSTIEKTYDGASGPIHALKGINLHVKRGEIYGVIGLSGAGKSTLIRCINMLEKPTKGIVVVDGEDLTAMNASQLRAARKNIGMIFQHFNLLSSATVYDNIAFPLRLIGMSKVEIEKKVLPLLELVGLADKRDQYPAQLSGGQKQRVGIARALASDPKVLLCDEATSALDPQTTKSILALIKDINQKLQLTVVLITHEMQVIKEICDKVAVIENGVIAEEGTVLEVFTNPQAEITKEFISVIINRDIPEAFKNAEISKTPVPGSNLLVRLSFIGDSADEPVISGVIRRFQVDTNIIYGNVDHIKNTPYGTLVLEITGEDAEIEKALKYLQDRNLGIEVIGYVS